MQLRCTFQSGLIYFYIHRNIKNYIIITVKGGGFGASLNVLHCLVPNFNIFAVVHHNAQYSIKWYKMRNPVDYKLSNKQ